MFIAIISKGLKVGKHPVVNRTASFTAETKAEVIQAAVASRREFEGKGYGPYRIFVGELTTEVFIPVEYSEKPIVAEGE